MHHSTSSTFSQPARSFAVAVQGEACSVIASCQDGRERLEIWEKVDARGDELLAKAVRGLRLTLPSTRCSVARLGISIAMELLGRLGEADEAEDGHVTAAHEQLEQVVTHGQQISIAAERVLSPRMAEIIARQVQRARGGGALP